MVWVVNLTVRFCSEIERVGGGGGSRPIAPLRSNTLVLWNVNMDMYTKRSWKFSFFFCDGGGFDLERNLAHGVGRPVHPLRRPHWLLGPPPQQEGPPQAQVTTWQPGVLERFTNTEGGRGASGWDGKLNSLPLSFVSPLPHPKLQSTISRPDPRLQSAISESDLLHPITLCTLLQSLQP